MRYTDTPFPPYAFVPGEHPHPTRNSRGHSYGEEEPDVESVEPSAWRDSNAFLQGVDLYNAGYLWEAHEAWEGLWLASRHDPTQTRFIQGLIQCAAGCLKIRMGQRLGMEKLIEEGTGRLRTVMREAGDEYMGVSISKFTGELIEFAATDPASIEGRPRLELAGER